MPRALSEIVARWMALSAGDLSDATFFTDEANRDRARAAWVVSNDPFSMLVLLQAIHGGRDVVTCEALAESMAFAPPLAQVRELQAKRQPGMHSDGGSPHTFIYLAQRVRRYLQDTPSVDQPLLAVRLADAIRSVVPVLVFP